MKIVFHFSNYEPFNFRSYYIYALLKNFKRFQIYNADFLIDFLHNYNGTRDKTILRYDIIFIYSFSWRKIYIYNNLVHSYIYIENNKKWNYFTASSCRNIIKIWKKYMDQDRKNKFISLTSRLHQISLQNMKLKYLT